MSEEITSLEVRCLGRPFKLGMLYDSASEKLVQNQMLWEEDALENAKQEKLSKQTEFTVIHNDSISSKCSHLGADDKLKMSFLGGLVNVSGSAKYLTDRISSKQQIRITLLCKFTSKVHELDIQQLGPPQNPSAIKGTEATHVVSGILYGLEAFFVFDRYLTGDEDATLIQGKMEKNTQFLSGIYETGSSCIIDIDEAEGDIYNCKIYCDAVLPDSPKNYRDALRILEQHLFRLFREDFSSTLIPMKAWLYPINKFDSSACSIVQELGKDSIIQTEKLIEGLHDIDVLASDIRNAALCLKIKFFQEQVSHLRALLKQFLNKLKRQLTSSVPKVRKGSTSIEEFATSLQESSNSAFCPHQLTSLLNGLENEMKAISTCLQNIGPFDYIPGPDEIDSLGYQYDYILSFEFRVSKSYVLHMQKLAQFLNNEKQSIAENTSTPWYKSGPKRRALQHQAKLYKEFAQVNCDKQNIKFVVSTSVDPMKYGNDGAAIVLYGGDEPIEFQPPSKPGKPYPTTVAENEITIAWPKPEHGCASIVSYTVHYRLLKEPQQEWLLKQTSQADESGTVDNLIPSSIYQFKVSAKCQVGASPTSDIVDVPTEVMASITASKTDSGHTVATSKNSSQTKSVALSCTDTVYPEDPKMCVSLTKPNNVTLSLESISQSQTTGSVKFPFSTELQSSSETAFIYAKPPIIDKTPIVYSLEPTSSLSLIDSVEKPTVSKLTYNSVQLEWKMPFCNAGKIDHYSVDYFLQQNPNGPHMIRKTDVNNIIIKRLSCETEYVFTLQASFCSGIKLESEPIFVRTSSHLAEKVRQNSKLIKEKCSTRPAIYELIKNPIKINNSSKIAKYEVEKPMDRGSSKVLMVVGATGAGKTTLINGIANYVYGVQWDDEFRFLLVSNEPAKKSQAHSQTSWITAYTLHTLPESPIPYSLTIIDTPGFGDTEGIERDKKIADQIKEFFSIHPPNGIDVLHGIGFVAQASLARLSPSQKYIFDSILSIYGRDVASNIFMMATFADGQRPPVLDAINEAKIPYQKCFKFNNSALFVTGETGSFDEMFWQMGTKSFRDFFTEFSVAEHKSLQLTREVLDEREQLENVLKQLQPQIHAGLTKMDELQQVVTMLQHNKDMVEQNKDFSFTVKVTKQRKVDTAPGRYTTNCLQCNYTCHESCAYARDEDKVKCSAMGGNGECTVCPQNCIWSKHVNNPYIFVLYDEEEVKTSNELKDRYDTAKEGECRAEIMIANIQDELIQCEDLVLGMVDQARRSLMRLDEIALKPNPLSEVDYIDQMIASEEQQAFAGWKNRVQGYKLLRKKATLMRKIKTHDQKGNESLFSYLGGASNTAYSPQTLDVFHSRHKRQKKSPGWYNPFAHLYQKFK